MDKLRMVFRKTGRAVYISHLDLMHTIQRAFSRTGYELKYSEGYNPRPVISILMPLSVGTASECELMDFKLARDYDIEKMPGVLNSSLPEGIEVLEVFEPVKKAAYLKWLRVRGIFEYDSADTTDVLTRLESFFSSETIMVNKHGKKGPVDVNIVPGISGIEFYPVSGGIGVEAVLSAQEPTINPDLLPEALRQNLPELAPDFVKCTRIAFYTSEMEPFR